MTKIDARGWVTEISDGAPTPVWSEIAGVDSFTHNPGENEESADTTTFTSDGVDESVPMQRGATLKLEGLHISDGAGVQDPGQTQATLLASKVGDEGLGSIRFRHITQTEWTVWTAWASLGEQGGENNDKTAWAVTFTRSGPATTEAVV